MRHKRIHSPLELPAQCLATLSLRGTLLTPSLVFVMCLGFGRSISLLYSRRRHAKKVQYKVLLATFANGLPLTGRGESVSDVCNLKFTLSQG